MSKHKYYFTLTAAFLTLFVSAQNSENIVLESNHQHEKHYPEKMDRRIVTTFSLEE